MFFKNRKILLLFPLFTGFMLLNGCSTPCNTLPPTDNPIIAGGYTRSITFNYLIDTDITNSDSRIKTLELVASQNPSAKFFIKYNDKAGKIFAQNLGNILTKDGFSNISLMAYKNNLPYTVEIYLNFKPLDRSVKNISLSQSESMNSIMGNLESGTQINDTINIRNN